MENWLEDLWRRENVDASEFTHYDGFSGTRSKIDRAYADIKIANNTRIKRKMISFSDHHNALLIDRLSSITKLGKDLWQIYGKIYNSSLLNKKNFCSTTRNMLSILETKKDNYSSTNDWWEYTMEQIKDDAQLFARNSKKQKNIRISRLKKRLQNLYKRENFKPEIRVMISNLQDELYTLETKQATGAKFRANIRWDLEGKKML